MKKILVLPIVMVLLGFGLSAQAASDARNLQTTGGAKRVALVIGNDHYRSVTPLKNAVADARSMAKALEQAGFAVTLKSDADLGTMKQAVRQFKAKLSGGDEAVFFYSGHGVQLGAANYLLPVDITSDNEEQVKDDAIPLQRLLDDLQDQKVKFALAIIDACRDNPFKGAGKRSIGNTRGLAATSAANGQMVIFSAGAGQQALDKLGNTDRDENGVFTRVFLQEMQKPGVEVHQVLRSVRSRVVQMAKSINHDQMPALYDQVEGDFYFQPGTGTQVASLEPVSAPARVKSREQIEDEYWDTVKDSDDIANFNQYLKAYPKGRYLNSANLKIAKLESDFWASIREFDNSDGYQGYLKLFPKGKYIDLAKTRIKTLAEEAAKQVAEQARVAQTAAHKEQAAWDSANSNASMAGYNSYLDDYPKGRHAALAQGRLDKLKNEVAQVKVGKISRECADCPEMIVIPAGSFIMGSDDDSAVYEKPIHRVILRSFSLGKTEVTQGQWKAVMGNNPSAFKQCGDDCPVDSVSWDDAQTYIRKLNAKTGKRFRLPSEAEWEYACRADGKYEYCGSNNLDSVGWYGNLDEPGGNSGKTTHPVGQKHANGFGLFDMSGNVLEWVEDGWHESYNGAPADGSVWPGNDGNRSVRGGSWKDYEIVAGPYARRKIRQDGVVNWLGFRLARTLP